MEDSYIIRLFLERSGRAVEELQQKYGRLCNAAARRILPDDRDAEECVSDACLRVWNTIPPQHPKSLKAYLLKITRNLALDRHDYNSAARRATELETAFEELEPCLPSTGSDVTEEMEFKRVLNGFLRSLPEKHRNCFIRRYWYGESVREISDAYSLSEENVKSILFRIRNKLKFTLEKEGISV